ncbi:MAG: hypothetical protein A3H43_03470 [Gammaproteobacteria bacterium RIFCSPLOWO2_02_FULL_42_9]|nr:MAG: hypothetical protein A3H43_03470 [Gammaproteobacteria bacterium RIFCSPLOWO2_02_FULL_42_9]
MPKKKRTQTHKAKLRKKRFAAKEAAADAGAPGTPLLPLPDSAAFHDVGASKREAEDDIDGRSPKRLSPPRRKDSTGGRVTADDDFSDAEKDKGAGAGGTPKRRAEGEVGGSAAKKTTSPERVRALLMGTGVTPKINRLGIMDAAARGDATEGEPDAVGDDIVDIAMSAGGGAAFFPPRRRREVRRPVLSVAAGEDESAAGQVLPHVPEVERVYWPQLAFDAAVQKIQQNLTRDVTDPVEMHPVRNPHLYDHVIGLAYEIPRDEERRRPARPLGHWKLELDVAAACPVLFTECRSTEGDRIVRVEFKGDSSFQHVEEPVERLSLVRDWVRRRHAGLLVQHALQTLTVVPLERENIDAFMQEFVAEKRPGRVTLTDETSPRRKERLLKALVGSYNEKILYQQGTRQFRADQNDTHMEQHMAVGGRGGKTRFHSSVTRGSVYLAGLNIIIDNSMRRFLHWAYENNIVLQGRPTFIVNLGTPIDQYNSPGWQYAHIESAGGAAGHFYPVNQVDFDKKGSTTFIVLDRYGNLDPSYYRLSVGQDPIEILRDSRTGKIQRRFDRVLKSESVSPDQGAGPAAPKSFGR